jgi:hypothetical protein
MLPRHVSQSDAAAVAADAFVFGYPLVLMNRVRAWLTAGDEPDPSRMHAPVNRFVHARAPRQAIAAHSAHADTLRSSAWLDLGDGPVLLSVPDTRGRFYAISFVDLWTNVFASVGARSTGTRPGLFAIRGPSWSCESLPPTAHPITAPTRMVRLAALTQVDGDADAADAHSAQDGYGISAPQSPGVSAARTPRTRQVGGTPPVAQLERMTARAFFGELGRIMRENPPRLEDCLIVDRMRRLGLVFDRDADWERLAPDVRTAVERGARQGLERTVAAAESPPGEAVGSWHIPFRIGQFGTDYLSRAGAACAGLEAGPAADELPALVRTDSDGLALSGRNGYLLRFAPGDTPPVHAFWTLTTFDDRQSLVDNPVERYSTGDWNNLTLDRDGSLSIRIQHQPPDDEWAPNWLPAPPGRFNILLRMCWPHDAALDRKWSPPEVERMRGSRDSCDPGDAAQVRRA